MDPVTLLIAAFVVGGMTVTLPRAVVDAFATAKAASAGQWDFIDADRQRRATRPPLAERVAAAWSARRQARSEQAGGDGTYQPGARAYFNDVYRGWWEDRLDHRRKKRAARPEWAYDPNRLPWHVRFDDAVLAKVEQLRTGWTRLAEPTEPAVASEPDAEPVTYPPGTVTFDDDGQQVPLTPQPQPTPEPTATPVEDTVTAPTINAAAATEVNTNEDARRMFTAMGSAAAELADAAAMAEAARAKLAAIAQGGADGMSAKAFDAGAAAAVQGAADVVSLGTLSEWSEAADAVSGAAQQGLASLDKYRDSEDLVASERIDPTTLAATSS